MQEASQHNQAFVDGQNLHYNTSNAETPWEVDLVRFRVYLREKYHVEQAYYFMGVMKDECSSIYQKIQEAGFILIFREYNSSMTGKKKGNVDTDVVFTIMRKIAEREKFDKILLVSGDGDYYRMVRYLIEKQRFCKLLSPNRHSTSSLYNEFTPEYVDFLDGAGLKRKIAIRTNKKAGSS